MRKVKMNLYEVGDIFLTMSADSPALRFVGTWELIAKGKTLVGVDPNDADFNVVNKTGGSKYLQSHNHGMAQLIGTSQSSYTTQISTPSGGNILLKYGGLQPTENSGAGNSGNLQPYLTCYIWCRTA